MITRVIAWVVLSVLAVAGYQAWDSWKNPWSSVSGVAVGSPVLSMLPPASDGCSKDCEK